MGIWRAIQESNFLGPDNLHWEAIVTKTYKKAMNLYQYLRPMSNHPPDMIKDRIYSLLKTYKNRNTYTEDYLDVMVKLFNRHAARNWNKTVPNCMIFGKQQ